MDQHNKQDRMLPRAEGRIVIAVPNGSILTADGSLESLRAALAEGKITRFAIANPEHAPYGKRAEDALKHAGLWDAIQPHLILGENVSQAGQFALSGNAEGGIIAYSLALAPELAAQGSHALIPADWHEPLLQRMVLLKMQAPWRKPSTPTWSRLPRARSWRSTASPCRKAEAWTGRRSPFRWSSPSGRW